MFVSQVIIFRYYKCPLQSEYPINPQTFIGIGAGIGGAVGANAPTQGIVWGHCPHTLPSSSYKHIKYFYIVRFVNSYQQLSPISVETRLHDYVVTIRIYLVTECIK